MAANIDSEVRRLIDEAHSEAAEIIIEHRDALDRLADALIEKETLDTPEVMAIMADVPKRPRRPAPPPPGIQAPPRRIRPFGTP